MQRTISVTAISLIGLILMVYTGSRVLDLIQMTLPADKQLLAYVGLGAFELGLLGWIGAYRYGASGNVQRAISITMIVISLLGIISGFVADTLIQAGKNGLTAKVDQSFVQSAIWITSIIIACNVVAVVMFHLGDPDHLQKQADEEAQGNIQDTARREIQKAAPVLAAQLAPIIVANWMQKMTAQYLASTNLTMQQPTFTTPALPNPILPPSNYLTSPITLGQFEQPMSQSSVTNEPTTNQQASNVTPVTPAVIAKQQPKQTIVTSAADSASYQDEEAEPENGKSFFTSKWQYQQSQPLRNRLSNLNLLNRLNKQSSNKSNQNHNKQP